MFAGQVFAALEAPGWIASCILKNDLSGIDTGCTRGASVFLSPDTSPSGACCFFDGIYSFVDILFYLSLGVAVILLIFGVVTFFRKTEPAGDENKKKKIKLFFSIILMLILIVLGVKEDIFAVMILILAFPFPSGIFITLLSLWLFQKTRTDNFNKRDRAKRFLFDTFLFAILALVVKLSIPIADELNLHLHPIFASMPSFLFSVCATLFVFGIVTLLKKPRTKPLVLSKQDKAKRFFIAAVVFIVLGLIFKFAVPRILMWMLLS
ncbi:MAG: hypothetical protein ABIF89_02655 [bacterium]